ncbi:MAG: hypothetical protein KBC38_02155 [Candidatus Pacebacteria bacterium]|nr:hypothetical protein [Candidatus Paceibacterota bacterium]MBP9840673.1 hypothetical protein [Candidatus Paceibacterota bacterium]
MLTCIVLFASVLSGSLIGVPLGISAPIVPIGLVLILPTAFAIKQDENIRRLPLLLLSFFIALGVMRAFFIPDLGVYAQVGATVVVILMMTVLFLLIRSRLEEEDRQALA